MSLTLEQIYNDQALRLALCEESYKHFVLYYFAHRVDHPFADFHEEIMHILETNGKKRLAFVGFREAAKTTLFGEIKIIYNICFKKSKSIIVLSEDAGSAKRILQNVINELQTNPLIINDFGHLYFERISRYGQTKRKTISEFETTTEIKVSAKGMGSKIRGDLYRGKYRPDLLLIDDFQSIKHIHNQEQRDKHEMFLRSEAFGSMATYGEIIMLGNMIHSDCIMARAEQWEGWKYYKVPIMINENPVWYQRYTITEKAAIGKSLQLENKLGRRLQDGEFYKSIEEIRFTLGSIMFDQECMLIPTDLLNRIIRPEWIDNYYKPEQFDPLKNEVIIGIDPAAKDKEKSDFTGLIAVGFDFNKKGYVVDWVNRRMSFNEMIEETVNMYHRYNARIILVENVAGFDYLRQQLKYNERLPVKGVTPKGDKKSRLISVARELEFHNIFFREKGLDKTLTDQLLNFNNILHEDLSDAFIHILEYKYRKIKTKMYSKKRNSRHPSVIR